MPYLTRPL